MAKNTVDPILFIQKNGDLSSVQKVGNAIVAQSKAKRVIAVSKTQPATEKALNAAKVAVINDKIYSFKKNNLTIKIVDLKRNGNEKLAYGGRAYVTIAVVKDGKPYSDYLPDVLSIVSQNKIIGIGGGKISYIKNGEATVIMYGDGR